MHRRGDVVPLGVEEVATQRRLGRVADRVQNAVQRVDVLAQLIGKGGEVVGVGHVELDDRHGRRQTPGDPARERHGSAERRQDDVRTFLLSKTRHVEGDRLVGEHARDQQALAFEDSHRDVPFLVASATSVAHAQAAIDRDDSTGDVGGGVAGEEHDRTGDLSG